MRRFHLPVNLRSKGFLMTITRFVLNEQSKHPESRGDFSILLSNIVLGCKFVCSAVNKAGLAKLIGLAGETNSILVSEEDEEAIFVEKSKRGKYCVVFDPLDGSSNIECGVSIGTIFGIYMIKDGNDACIEDVLQLGKEMLAAGYCMYGSSCTLVLSTGSGVNGFTLDPSLGEFILTHPDIKVATFYLQFSFYIVISYLYISFIYFLYVHIPKKGKIYSVNEGNAKNWDGPTAKYVERCKYPTDGSPAKSLR
ncbi:hypothetical protein LXL04_030194 [Taraxacum kok-saghyz]